MDKKLKSLLHDDLIFMALLVILTGLVSFYLGRASVAGRPAVTQVADQPATVVLTQSAKPSEIKVAATNSPEILPPAPAAAGKLVASKSGTKYHLATCGSAKAIKEENRIYFNSETEAMAAGYTRAANCSGW